MPDNVASNCTALKPHLANWVTADTTRPSALLTIGVTVGAKAKSEPWVKISMRPRFYPKWVCNLEDLP